MTTEEKIHIAASFDSEKIKMIRELIKTEVMAAFNWAGDNYYDFVNISLWENDELYNLYEASKLNKPNKQ
jgi:hypothetical protein